MQPVFTIRLKLKNKTSSWLPAFTLATVTIECVPPPEYLQRFQAQATLVDMYEPCSNSNIFAPSSDGLSEILQSDNCLGFLFFSPAVSILNVHIEHENGNVQVSSIALGISKSLGDVGFEYCCAERKWTPYVAVKTNSPSFELTNYRCQSAGKVNVLLLGLRTYVSTTSLFWTEIIERSCNIVKSLDDSKSDSNLENLSAELLCRIAKFVPGPLRLPALISLSGACRRLRWILSHPSFYRSMDLRYLELNDYQLNFIEKRFPPSLEQLSLPYYGEPLNMASLLSLFTSVKSLNFRGSSAIDDVVLNIICKFFADSLVELDLSQCHSISTEGFKVLDKFYRLKALSLSSTLISKDVLITVINSNPGLEFLCLSSISSLAPYELDDVCGHFGPKLKYLDLSCSDRLTLSGLRRISDLCCNLVELNIRRCGNLNIFVACDLSSCGALLSAGCPKLKVLGLPIIVTLDDILSLRYLQQLEELFIHQVVDCSKEQLQEGLAEVIESCRRLNYITIRRQSTVDGIIDEEFCRLLLPKTCRPITITPLQW